jgi:hypothetical protein
MAIVTHTHRAGKDLTPEEREAARLRIEEAAKFPYVYDPDCPLLTPEQLAEFRPAYFATMEERDQAMRDAGIVYSEDGELLSPTPDKLEEANQKIWEALGNPPITAHGTHGRDGPLKEELMGDSKPEPAKVLHR